MRVSKSRATKLWFPYNLNKESQWNRRIMFPPPRLVQLLKIVWCAVVDDDWHGEYEGGWRIETEDWWEPLRKPEPYAWRSCRRCSRIEHVLPPRT